MLQLSGRIPGIDHQFGLLDHVCVIDAAMVCNDDDAVDTGDELIGERNAVEVAIRALEV